MNPATPTPQQCVRFHLRENRTPVNGGYAYSSFTLALRQSRCATGRDADTGHKLPDCIALHGSWLGAIGYMCLVDQIARCFVPPRTIPGATNAPYPNALAGFAPPGRLTDDEAFAVYALRCSFAHEFALVNLPTNPNRTQLIHHFLVTQGTLRVVTLPSTPWDGCDSTKTDQNRTTVDLEALGDLVEAICRQLRELNELGHLQLHASCGLLQGRYAMESPQ